MGFIWNNDNPTDSDVAFKTTHTDLVMLLWFIIFFVVGLASGYFMCTKKAVQRRRKY